MGDLEFHRLHSVCDLVLQIQHGVRLSRLRASRIIEDERSNETLELVKRHIERARTHRFPGTGRKKMN